LTIGKLTPGRAAYYCDQLPGGQDEYYTGEREEPGHWLGHAAERFDLAGPVDPEAFRRILDARHPLTGAPLGVPGTTDQRLAGFDLCFSAPKSVSVAWVLAPPEMATTILAAHDRAVAEAVDALEAEAVRARRGAGGLHSVETEGVVAAAFGHRTSRAGDPQLHTHLVVANATPDADGRWTALDGARVYRWAKTIGHLYQASLRHHLTEDLGVEWGPVHRGAADLANIPASALHAFSQRAAQINQALRGPSGGVPLSVHKAATLATRPAKADLPHLDQLRRQWADQAVALGLPENPLETGVPAPVPPSFDELADQLTGPSGLTAHSSHFDRRAVLQALADHHRSGRSAAELRWDADRLLAHPEVVLLTADRRSGPIYSTAELLAIEEAMVTSASRRTGDGVGVTPPQTIEETDGSPLSSEQQAMVESLTTSGAGVEVVIGRAGAGKTYALDAARRAWEDTGHRVIGAALAARAAAELQAGAGITSTTLERLLADLDRPGPLSALPPRTVLVIDEAAMVGTRQLSRVLDHAERARAKVVLVGDPRQLPEIEAGGAVTALAAHVPTTELTDNRRQVHEWERAALAELRAGHVPAAFAAYRQHGRITIADGADRARAAMVAAWWAATEDGQDTAMYALRRSDVADLNARARALLEASGRLGAERLEVADREFAVGDRVMCLRNDRRLGVRNGTSSELTAVDPVAGTATLADGTVLPAGYLADGHLTHGYATTIHKAQGATVDRAFVLGSEALYRESGYVGLSRARHGSDLYIVGPAHPNPEIDPVAETIRRLATSRAQTLARDLMPVDDVQAHGVAPSSRLLLADPPDWIVEALGPPPLDATERDRWSRHAGRLAAYADTVGRPLDAGPSHPLGDRPDDPARRKAWDLARLTLIEHDRQLQLSHSIEQEGLSL
jgi:conjugative relaxase-like TrwC/TraI family protein